MNRGDESGELRTSGCSKKVGKANNLNPSLIGSIFLASIIFGFVLAYYVPLAMVRIFQIVFDKDLSDDYGLGLILIMAYPFLVFAFSLILFFLIKNIFIFLKDRNGS